MPVRPSTQSSAAATPALVPQGAHVGKPAMPMGRAFTMIGARHRAHLHLLSRSVSKAHAVVINDNGNLYIRDTASREHVFVNGRPVMEGDLKHGDLIKIGSFTFQLVDGSRRSGKTPRKAAPKAIVQPSDSLATTIEGRTLVIGRRPTCDLVLSELAVSNVHAIIFEYNGQYYIRDLGSRTGTYINGEQVHQQSLKFDDQIRIGEHDLQFSPALVPEEEFDELEHLIGTAPLLDEPEMPAEAAQDLDVSIEPLPVAEPAVSSRFTAPPLPEPSTVSAPQPEEPWLAEERAVTASTGDLTRLDQDTDLSVSGLGDTHTLPPEPPAAPVRPPVLSPEVVDEADEVGIEAEERRMLVGGDLHESRLSGSGSFANLKHTEEETSSAEPTPLDLDDLGLGFPAEETSSHAVPDEPIAPAEHPLDTESVFDLQPEAALEAHINAQAPVVEPAEHALDADSGLDFESEIASEAPVIAEASVAEPAQHPAVAEAGFDLEPEVVPEAPVVTEAPAAGVAEPPDFDLDLIPLIADEVPLPSGLESLHVTAHEAVGAEIGHEDESISSAQAIPPSDFAMTASDAIIEEHPSILATEHEVSAVSESVRDADPTSTSHEHLVESAAVFDSAPVREEHAPLGHEPLVEAESSVAAPQSPGEFPSAFEIASGHEEPELFAMESLAVSEFSPAVHEEPASFTLESSTEPAAFSAVNEVPAEAVPVIDVAPAHEEPSLLSTESLPGPEVLPAADEVPAEAVSVLDAAPIHEEPTPLTVESLAELELLPAAHETPAEPAAQVAPSHDEPALLALESIVEPDVAPAPREMPTETAFAFNPAGVHEEGALFTTEHSAENELSFVAGKTSLEPAADSEPAPLDVAPTHSDAPHVPETSAVAAAASVEPSLTQELPAESPEIPEAPASADAALGFSEPFAMADGAHEASTVHDEYQALNNVPAYAEEHTAEMLDLPVGELVPPAFGGGVSPTDAAGALGLPPFTAVEASAHDDLWLAESAAEHEQPAALDSASEFIASTESTPESALGVMESATEPLLDSHADMPPVLDQLSDTHFHAAVQEFSGAESGPLVEQPADQERHLTGHAEISIEPEPQPEAELAPTEPQLSVEPEPAPTEPRLSVEPEPGPAEPQLSVEPEPAPTEPQLSVEPVLFEPEPEVSLSPPSGLEFEPVVAEESNVAQPAGGTLPSFEEILASEGFTSAPTGDYLVDQAQAILDHEGATASPSCQADSIAAEPLLDDEHSTAPAVVAGPHELPSFDSMMSENLLDAQPVEVDFTPPVHPSGSRSLHLAVPSEMQDEPAIVPLSAETFEQPATEASSIAYDAAPIDLFADEADYGLVFDEPVSPHESTSTLGLAPHAPASLDDAGEGSAFIEASPSAEIPDLFAEAEAPASAATQPDAAHNEFLDFAATMPTGLMHEDEPATQVVSPIDSAPPTIDETEIAFTLPGDMELAPPLLDEPQPLDLATPPLAEPLETAITAAPVSDEVADIVAPSIDETAAEPPALAELEEAAEWHEEPAPAELLPLDSTEAEPQNLWPDEEFAPEPPALAELEQAAEPHAEPSPGDAFPLDPIAAEPSIAGAELQEAAEPTVEPAAADLLPLDAAEAPPYSAWAESIPAEPPALAELEEAVAPQASPAPADLLPLDATDTDVEAHSAWAESIPAEPPALAELEEAVAPEASPAPVDLLPLDATDTEVEAHSAWAESIPAEPPALAELEEAVAPEASPAPADLLPLDATDTEVEAHRSWAESIPAEPPALAELEEAVAPQASPAPADLLPLDATDTDVEAHSAWAEAISTEPPALAELEEAVEPQAASAPAEFLPLDSTEPQTTAGWPDVFDPAFVPPEEGLEFEPEPPTAEAHDVVAEAPVKSAPASEAEALRFDPAFVAPLEGLEFEPEPPTIEAHDVVAEAPAQLASSAIEADESVRDTHAASIAEGLVTETVESRTDVTTPPVHASVTPPLPAAAPPAIPRGNPMLGMSRDFGSFLGGIPLALPASARIVPQPPAPVQPSEPAQFQNPAPAAPRRDATVNARSMTSHSANLPPAPPTLTVPHDPGPVPTTVFQPPSMPVSSPLPTVSQSMGVTSPMSLTSARASSFSPPQKRRSIFGETPVSVLMHSESNLLPLKPVPIADLNPPAPKPPPQPAGPPVMAFTAPTQLMSPRIVNEKTAPAAPEATDRSATWSVPPSTGASRIVPVTPAPPVAEIPQPAPEVEEPELGLSFDEEPESAPLPAFAPSRAAAAAQRIAPPPLPAQAPAPRSEPPAQGITPPPLPFEPSPASTSDLDADVELEVEDEPSALFDEAPEALDSLTHSLEPISDITQAVGEAPPPPPRVKAVPPPAAVVAPAIPRSAAPPAAKAPPRKPPLAEQNLAAPADTAPKARRPVPPPPARGTGRRAPAPQGTGLTDMGGSADAPAVDVFSQSSTNGDTAFGAVPEIPPSTFIPPPAGTRRPRPAGQRPVAIRRPGEPMPQKGRKPAVVEPVSDEAGEFDDPAAPAQSPGSQDADERKKKKKKKWKFPFFGMLGLALAGGGAAAGIWYGMPPKSDVQAALRFDGLDKLSTGTRHDFELDQQARIATEEFRKSVQAIYETEFHGHPGDGFIYRQADDDVDFASIAQAGHADRDRFVLERKASRDREGDRVRFQSVLKALYVIDSAQALLQRGPQEKALSNLAAAETRLTEVQKKIADDQKKQSDFDMARKKEADLADRSAQMEKIWTMAGAMARKLQTELDTLLAATGPAALVEDDARLKELLARLKPLSDTLAAARATSAASGSVSFDLALAQFQQQIESTRLALNGGASLSAYLAVGQQARTAMQQAGDDLAGRQKASRQALADLNKSLAEKIDVHLKRLYADDASLVKLEQDRAVQEHRLGAATGAGLTDDAAQIRPQVDALKKSIDARHAELMAGDPSSDEIRSIQKAINDQTEQMHSDRARADQRVTEQFALIAAAAPKPESLPDDQAQQLALLDQKAAVVNVARQQMTQTAAPAPSVDVKTLEGQVVTLEAQVDARRTELAAAAKAAPSSVDKAVLAQKRMELDDAQKAETRAMADWTAAKKDLIDAQAMLDALQSTQPDLVRDNAVLESVQTRRDDLKRQSDRLASAIIPVPQDPGVPAAATLIDITHTADYRPAALGAVGVFFAFAAGWLMSRTLRPAKIPAPASTRFIPRVDPPVPTRRRPLTAA